MSSVKQVCGNSRRATAMYLDRRPQKSGSQSIHSERTSEDHGGEASQHNSGSVGTLFTKLCGNLICGRSCGKIILVDVFPTANPENQKRVYAVIDDQSNRLLISTNLLDQLAISGECEPYTLSSCSGVSTQYGRRVNGLCVKSFDGSDTLNLPELIECNSIPSSRHEIPTPDVAQAYPHLCHIASSIPPLDHEAKIELLIGRDIPQVHHVLDQVIGDKGQPFAQRLLFGWVIIGEVCIGQVHAPREVNVRKTQILNDGRCTTFPLCPYNISVKSKEDEVFVRTPDDNKVGMSVEDKQFLKFMDEEFKIDETGHWSAPLPFKDTKPVMPNNYPQALKRAHILDANLRKDSNERQHFYAFTEKVLSSGAAEVAPTKIDGKC